MVHHQQQRAPADGSLGGDQRSVSPDYFMAESFVQIGKLMQASEDCTSSTYTAGDYARGGTTAHPAIISESDEQDDDELEPVPPPSRRRMRPAAVALLLLVVVAVLASVAAAVHFKQQADGYKASWQQAVTEREAAAAKLAEQEAALQEQQRRREQWALRPLYDPMVPAECGGGGNGVIVNTCFLQVTLGECGRNFVDGANSVVDGILHEARAALHNIKAAVTTAFSQHPLASSAATAATIATVAAAVTLDSGNIFDEGSGPDL